jgi:hypothetical protein
MRTIIILDGEDPPAAPRGRPVVMAQASMVLTASGRILKSANGWADYTVDMDKLNSVLNGEKRVRKAKSEGA